MPRAIAIRFRVRDINNVLFNVAPFKTTLRLYFFDFSHYVPPAISVGGLFQHVIERFATSSPLQFQIAGAKVKFDWLRAKYPAIFYPIFLTTETKSTDNQLVINKNSEYFLLLKIPAYRLKSVFD